MSTQATKTELTTVSYPVSREARRLQRKLRRRAALRRVRYAVRTNPRHPIAEYHRTRLLEQAIRRDIQRLFFGESA